MPKLKTHSGAKKRFSVSASGKIIAKHAGKRHGMIKRTQKQVRNLRQALVLNPCETKRVKRHLLPNS